MVEILIAILILFVVPWIIIYSLDYLAMPGPPWLKGAQIAVTGFLAAVAYLAQMLLWV